jgi:probable DNA metabolism protein
MMDPWAAQWDGSLESLFALLDETCRQGTPPRRLERTGAAGGGDGPVQPELFAVPETTMAVPPVRAADREQGPGGPVFPEFSRTVFPDLRHSGCPSGSFSAVLLCELSVNAFDAVVHAWMSELPIVAEIIRFAWKVISAAWKKVFQEGPPGTEPPDRSGLLPEPAAGTDVSAAGAFGAVAIQNPRWAALPEARWGAEQAASDRGDQDVRTVLEAAYKTGREIDRLRGLLRFTPYCSGGDPASALVYVARCFPDHHVLPGLVDHFTQRFGECPWAVIDEKRNLVLVREAGREARIFPLNSGETPAPGLPDCDCGHSLDNGHQFDGIEDLWRNYHHSINNPDRNNPALQRHFMPRRYWKYLPELQN